MVAGPIAQDEVPTIKRNPWADNFFRPVLITIMIMCVSLSMVNLVRLINPAWRGAYFLVGMLLTTVEAIYSYRLLRVREIRGTNRIRYRLAEWVVLMLVLKLLSYTNKPAEAIWAELQLIWQDPFNFINLEYYLLLVMAAVVWLAATGTVEDFEALHDPYSFYSDRILPLDNLASRFFWGGGVLVLISGVTQWLTRAGLSSLIDFQRPSIGGVIFNVLVYFVLGLVLLSQAHLTRLLIRWRIQKISVASDLVKQWARYGFIFLAVVGLLVFALPTSYTLGFLTSAGLAVELLLNTILFILQLIFFLLSLPLIWLLTLLGQEPEVMAQRGMEPLTLPDGPAGGPAPSWLEIIRSLIFWLVIAAIAWYLLKTYLNENPGVLRELQQIRGIGAFFRLLARLWRQLWSLTQAGWDMIPKRIRFGNEREGRAGRFGFRRWAGLGSLSPRERILYYYLNIVERAKKPGPTRGPNQTPYEYEPDLSGAVPEAEQDVNILTRAFVHARYSRETFDDTQAALARALWRRIRQALTTRRQKGEDEKSD